MYSEAPKRPPHSKRTDLVLLTGQKPLERMRVLGHWTKESLAQGWSVGVLASGEIFTIRDTAVHAQVFELDQGLKAAGARVIRLTPGCVCCSSKLIVQTHLSRLMRLNQPDALVLELDGQSHVDQVIEWLGSDQWSDWFSTVSVKSSDSEI